MFIEKMLRYSHAIRRYTKALNNDDRNDIEILLTLMMEDSAEMEAKYNLACNIIKSEVK